jgi:hypothetical protein
VNWKSMERYGASSFGHFLNILEPLVIMNVNGFRSQAWSENAQPHSKARRVASPRRGRKFAGKVSRYALEYPWNVWHLSKASTHNFWGTDGFHMFSHLHFEATSTLDICASRARARHCDAQSVPAPFQRQRAHLFLARIQGLDSTRVNRWWRWPLGA